MLVPAQSAAGLNLCLSLGRLLRAIPRCSRYWAAQKVVDHVILHAQNVFRDRTLGDISRQQAFGQQPWSKSAAEVLGQSCHVFPCPRRSLSKLARGGVPRDVLELDCRLLGLDKRMVVSWLPDILAFASAPTLPTDVFECNLLTSQFELTTMGILGTDNLERKLRIALRDRRSSSDRTVVGPPTACPKPVFVAG